MRTRIHVLLLPALLMASLFHGASTLAQDTPPLRVAVVGLTHGHVGGFFEQLPSHQRLLIEVPTYVLRNNLQSNRVLALCGGWEPGAKSSRGQI